MHTITLGIFLDDPPACSEDIQHFGVNSLEHPGTYYCMHALYIYAQFLGNCWCSKCRLCAMISAWYVQNPHASCAIRTIIYIVHNSSNKCMHGNV